MHWPTTATSQLSSARPSVRRWRERRVRLKCERAQCRGAHARQTSWRRGDAPTCTDDGDAGASWEGGMERRKEEGGGGGGGGGEGGRRSVCVRVRVWIAKSDLFSWLLLLEWREGGGGCGGGGVGTMAAIFVHFGCGMLVAECLWATNVSHSELQGCQAVVGILGGPNTMRMVWQKDLTGTFLPHGSSLTTSVAGRPKGRQWDGRTTARCGVMRRWQTCIQWQGERCCMLQPQTLGFELKNGKHFWMKL